MKYAPTHDIDELRRMLKQEFQSNADERRQRAFARDDQRHEAVAAIFDQYAATVSMCPAEVIDTYQSLFIDSTEVDDWLATLRGIRPGAAPGTAEELLRQFIAEQSGG